jgi:hypothetical protein
VSRDESRRASTCAVYSTRLISETREARRSANDGGGVIVLFDCLIFVRSLFVMYKFGNST